MPVFWRLPPPVTGSQSFVCLSACLWHTRAHRCGGVATRLGKRSLLMTQGHVLLCEPIDCLVCPYSPSSVKTNHLFGTGRWVISNDPMPAVWCLLLTTSQSLRLFLTMWRTQPLPAVPKLAPTLALCSLWQF